MTVTYEGPSWLKPLIQRCDYPYYNRITEVHLSGDSYADDVIPHVARFRHLKRLSLSKTKITGEGLATLRASLSQCDIDVR